VTHNTLIRSAGRRTHIVSTSLLSHPSYIYFLSPLSSIVYILPLSSLIHRMHTSSYFSQLYNSFSAFPTLLVYSLLGIMSQPPIEQSAPSIPPKEQLRLMRSTLEGLEGDPAIVYARWVQQTGTCYICTMGVTITGSYSTNMEATELSNSSLSLNGVFRLTSESQDTVILSSVSDPKTDQFGNRIKESSESTEITPDLNDGNHDATTTTESSTGISLVSDIKTEKHNAFAASTAPVSGPNQTPAALVVKENGIAYSFLHNCFC